MDLPYYNSPWQLVNKKEQLSVESCSHRDVNISICSVDMFTQKSFIQCFFFQSMLGQIKLAIKSCCGNFLSQSQLNQSSVISLECTDMTFLNRHQVFFLSFSQLSQSFVASVSTCLKPAAGRTSVVLQRSYSV